MNNYVRTEHDLASNEKIVRPIDLNSQEDSSSIIIILIVVGHYCIGYPSSDR